MGRIKIAVGTLVAIICLGLAACGASNSSGGAQPSSSGSSSSGWG